MSSCSFVFITAKKADVKLVNRFLLTIRDWEFGDDAAWDCFSLVTSKTDPLPLDAESTKPPLQELPLNEWEGSPIEDIEAKILERGREEESVYGRHEGANNMSLFLVLDDKGVEDRTVILSNRAIDWDADPLTYPERFNKFRTPWASAYLDWCNLDISNIGWSEMCDLDGADEGKSEKDGVWWTYGHHTGELTSEENRKRRDAVIKELEGLGQA
ncbi:hypothetical protein CORC01_04427 [Colletotrichum orchidophilum]|uniref:Uncharacterized protein n=1 Tax=Colletotrichum orchidophilum TaxID=1209926 RepID=A0A1G4BFW0_9PEZI|nr:uncharacterized protein CORC01_04427 [Colletotrichum orchidophilum]OHF00238.1 hypothetical protein CORC01_04427 [Colletotrichum orchidophilum]